MLAQITFDAMHAHQAGLGTTDFPLFVRAVLIVLIIAAIHAVAEMIKRGRKQ